MVTFCIKIVNVVCFFAQSSHLEGDMTQLRAQLKEASDDRDAALEHEERAVADLRAQTQLAADAQEKYERELLLHANDVTTLTKLKEQVERHEEQVRAAKQSAAEAEAKLVAERASWTEQRRLAGEERNRFQENIAELTKQNETLHETLDKVSPKVLETSFYAFVYFLPFWLF